jgi:2-phosphosulfolactate phosphatase
MRVHVAFTPDEAAPAPVAIVVDVLRATSTITQALASGFRRVLCCAEIEEARELRAEIPDSLVGGERQAVRIEGFDVGASPREFLEPQAETLILSTTNGTRAILEAAQRSEHVVLGSLLNLEAVAGIARGKDVVIVCAGFQGAFALDDAYCAGRIVQRLDAARSDASVAADLVARAFPNAEDGLNARTYGPPGLEEDIVFCARESVLDVVPRLVGRVGPAAEIALAWRRLPCRVQPPKVPAGSRGSGNAPRSISPRRNSDARSGCCWPTSSPPATPRESCRGSIEEWCRWVGRSRRTATCSCTRWGGGTRAPTV